MNHSPITRRSVLAMAAVPLLLPKRGSAGVARPGTASYTGPLDIVPGAVVAYSQRALAAAWISNTITIRRDSDDATMSFAPTASNAVDTAAITAFLGSANGFVSSWADQSGHAVNVVNATALTQPSWVLSSIGGKPSIESTYSTLTKLLATSGVSADGSGFTIFVVSKLNSPPINQTNILFVAGDGSNGPDLFLDVSNLDDASIGVLCGSDDLGENNGFGISASAAVGDSNTATLIAASFNSAVSISVNGTVPGSVSNIGYGGADTPLINQPMAVGVNSNAAFGSDAFMSEIVIYGSVLSAPNMTAIQQNIAAYYGITLS